MTHRADCFFVACVAVLCLAAGPAPSRRAAASPSRADLLAAEAARATSPAQLEVLKAGLRSPVPTLQRVAVRALGRIERADLLADIFPMLSAVSPDVRGEAANAVAQAASAGPATAMPAAGDRLVERLQVETDDGVRGDLCAALGRLPYDARNDVDRVQKMLADEVGRALSHRPPAWPAAEGALRGLESLIRLRARLAKLSDETRTVLETAVGASGTMVRRLAILVLNLAGGPSAPLVTQAARDADGQVRRLAMAAATASQEVIQKGLNDPVPMVRLEALRAWGRRFQATAGCAPVLDAARDSVIPVSLAALDLLGAACRPEDPVSALLLPLAADSGGLAWHRSSHALVALARVSPERGAAALTAHLGAEPWQRRMYAAQAAAILRNEAALRRLAGDPSSNVQEAALSALSRLVGHSADALSLQALSSEDPQLVMTAARALKGTPDREPAARALLSSLNRLTAVDSDNTRDPRMAILDRLEEVATSSDAAALEPLLADFDPKVAARASAISSAWSGIPRPAAPRSRPLPGVPDDKAIERMARTRVTVTMAGGNTFELELLADLAPLACARFLELAAAGYYHGLTFHRIVPNFVIQGGSPGANEFWGHQRFMRDEVGRAMQARGTVGISTRGRDTGDAQFYVNLVDLPRLDHEYTVFARVTAGMSAVDAILEGDRIASVRASGVPAKGNR